MKQLVWISGLLGGSALGSYVIYGEIKPYSVIIGALLGYAIGHVLKIGKEHENE